MNNVIYDNIGTGIQQNGSSTSTYKATRHPSPAFSGAANWLVANNTLAYQRYASGHIIWGALTADTQVINNIFYENKQDLASSSKGQAVFFTGTGAPGIVIRNNLSYATTPGGTTLIGGQAIEGTGYTESDNIVGSHPGFVNAPAAVPASPNFALIAQSAAVDAGLPLGDVATDIIGTPRPDGAAHDMGAYEYSSAPGPDDVAPSSPTGLTIL